MDIHTDKSNTEILIEMVDNVTHKLERLNKLTAELQSKLDAMEKSIGASPPIDLPPPRGTIKFITKPEAFARSQMSDAKSAEIAPALIENLAKHQDAMDAFNERVMSRERTGMARGFESVVAQLRRATGDPDLQIDYTNRSHPIITTKCDFRTAESLAHKFGPMTWSRITVQPPAEEAGPNIAERLKAGDADVLGASMNLAKIVEENTSAKFQESNSPIARFKYPSLTHDACFTIYATGKATTGGKDSDLRQVLRDILGSEGFDVRC